MDTGEYLFPLHSVKSFISDKLNIYKMNPMGNPDVSHESNLGEVASTWVSTLDKDDETLVTEMIYWWRKENL